MNWGSVAFWFEEKAVDRTFDWIKWKDFFNIRCMLHKFLQKRCVFFICSQLLLFSDLFPVTIEVTSTDSAYDTVGSLGAAILAAVDGTTVIDCSPIAGQTIDIGRLFPVIGGNFTLPTSSITILGSGVTIDGGGSHAVFSLAQGSATISNLTIQNGLSQGGNGGLGLTGGGGGTGGGGALYILSGTTMTISAVSLMSNQAIGGAGGESNSTGGSGGGGGGFGGGAGGRAIATGASTGSAGGGGGNNGGVGGGRDGGAGSPNTFSNYAGAGGGGETPGISTARTGGSVAAAGLQPAHSGGSGGAGTSMNGAGAGGGGGSGGSGFHGTDSTTPPTSGNGVGGAGGLGVGVDNSYGVGGGGGGGNGGGNGGAGVSNFGSAGGGGGLTGPGGAGGIFGGGGGASGSRTGGAGGFGAGGGAGSVGGVDMYGLGGAGGSGSPAGGGGGSGLGGAIFVQIGGLLIIEDGVSFSGNSTTPGTASGTGSSGGNGSSLGQDIFVQAGGSVTFQVNGAFTLPNPIKGGGLLSQATGPGVTTSGTGTVSLNGANTYLGGTLIQSGILNLNGSVSGDVNIDSGGTLSGNATVSGSIISSGTISPGNSIGTIFSGPVQLSGSSIFEVELDPTGIDLLNVSGTAMLAGTLEITQDPGTGFSNGPYTFLQTTGGISGAFDTIIINELPGYRFVLGNDGFNLFLTLFGLPIQTSGLSGNAKSVAKYLNNNAPLSTITLVNGLSGSALNQALNSISPARNAYTGFINNQNAFSLSRLVSMHTDRLRWMDQVEQKSKFIATLTADASAKTRAPPKKKKNSYFTSWIGSFADFMHVGSFQENPSFDLISEAVLVGTDYWIERGRRVGISLGYVHSNFSESHHQGRGNINSGFLSLYGDVSFGRFYIEPALWGIFNDSSNHRNIVFSGFSEQAHAHLHSWQFVPHLGVGYDFKMGWVDVEPFASADYAINWQRGYREKGASPFNAHQHGKTTSIVKSEVGLRVFESWRFDWGMLFVKEKASYIFEKPFGHNFVVAFTGIPSSMTVTALDHTLNIGSIGLELFTSIGHKSPLGIAISYDGEFSHKYWSNELMLTFSKKF